MTLPDTRRITDSDAAARALRQHHAFLGLFVQPQSPSSVAGSVGMAASLAHHHARKLAALGLLHEQRREGGKVYEQLTAREFQVPSTLIPPPDSESSGAADVTAISAAFLKIYERSWTFIHDSEEDSYAFRSADLQPPLPAPPDSRSPESHPAHLNSVTLVLSPEQYQRLARTLSTLLAQAYAGGSRPEWAALYPRRPCLPRSRRQSTQPVPHAQLVLRWGLTHRAHPPESAPQPSAVCSQPPLTCTAATATS